MEFYARPGQSLEQHLRKVSEQAAQFADVLHGQEWARLAGLWHDLGKYNPAWQEYLQKSIAGENPDKIGHAAAGALWAKQQFGDVPGVRILQYLIACHHTGLQDYTDLQSHLAGEKASKSFKNLAIEEISENTKTQLLPAFPDIKALKCSRDDTFGFSLWIRLLFSALIDADRWDAAGQPATSYPSMESLKEKLDAALQEKAKQSSEKESNLHQTRQEILQECRKKALLEQGLFSLTVPTGGGKTLSSMAFALDHAIKHNQRRVIYVIPYTSIIEQNARVLKEIFGKENVIEHHSNFDVGNDNQDYAKAWELATENWDAPIIVTTNVQFFESLFAAKTSRVRKIHNIANSAVVLDEAQLLPVGFLRPVLKTIQQLADVYKTTFVFCTATQPALTTNNPALKKDGFAPEAVREIIADPAKLAGKLERVKICRTEGWDRPRDAASMAAELAAHRQVLCVVNTRDDARNYYKALCEQVENKQTVFHLSALMCPAHRSLVINQIKARLAEELPVQVISTQLIEAGVDIDFPVVYRAMAGLDSIAQAAGRCNREGKLGERGGKVVLFSPEKPPPTGILRKGKVAAEDVMRHTNGSLIAPSVFERYFNKFYPNVNELDTGGIIEHDLKMQGTFGFDFGTAAEKFKLIEEGHQLPVITFNAKSEEEVKMLCNILRNGNYERWIMRKLQGFTVNIPKSWHKDLLNKSDIEEIIPNIFAQKTSHSYHHALGLVGDDDTLQTPESFIA